MPGASSPVGWGRHIVRLLVVGEHLEMISYWKKKTKKKNKKEKTQKRL